ncbi:MAG: flagellar filament capping protein FliD [Clostridium sp.]|uniref:flagellar filament capping protein FliD n=1 Tax=Clostridium sp. TaxID=1506 RepID=UPI002FCCA1B4
MVMRIGGLATGLDTDSVIKQMLMKDQEKVDKVKGEKQVLQWKQEIYRDVIGNINKFKSKYFDVLNKGSFALSPDFFSSLTSKVVGDSYGLVNIKPTNTAKPGRYEVTVNQNATGAKAESTLTTLTGGKVSNTTKLSEIGDVGDGKLNIKYGNNAEVTINVDANTTVGDLVKKINSDPALKGKVSANFSEISGKIAIETVDTGVNQKLSISGGAIGALKMTGGANGTINSTAKDVLTHSLSSGVLKINGNLATGANTLADLGITGPIKVQLADGSLKEIPNTTTLSGMADLTKPGGPLENTGITASYNETTGKLSFINTEGKPSFKVVGSNDDLKKLGLVSGAETEVTSTGTKTSTRYDLGITPSNNITQVSINGKAVTLPAFDGVDINVYAASLNEAAGALNGTGVTAEVVDGKMVLTSKTAFSMSGTSADLANIGYSNLVGITGGKNAEVSITLPDGTKSTIVNEKNIFTIDGLTFDIKGMDPSKKIVFNIESDVDKAMDNIKGFVKDYNDMIDSIASKIYQKKQYTYKPLTEEQKKDMSEEEIKKWEEKCKEGIIKSDPSLEKMLSEMRQAFFAPVSGVNISLKDIGLSTSSDYTQRGKIEIDEGKLRQALMEKPDDVAALFTKDNAATPYDKDKGYAGNANRRDNVGIFQRLNDIVEDSIRVTRNTNGKKGSLIEIAGIKGDSSDFKNSIADRVKSKDDMLRELVRKMGDKEKRLYAKFSRLETMMNNYNSQTSWLQQQIGGM